MKFLPKITVVVLALGCITAFSSCGDDDDGVAEGCYECEAFTDSNGNTFNAETFCVGDDDGTGNGTVYTQATLDADIALLALAGVTCNN